MPEHHDTAAPQWTAAPPAHDDTESQKSVAVALGVSAALTAGGA